MSRDEDYDDYDDAPAQKVWGAASILVGVAALAGFLALAWYAYHSGSATTDPAQAELVQADPTPYKEVPKDPGGWQAPHRDKTIYEVIDNNGKPASPTAERLTPAPEEPMDVTTSESGTSTWMNSKLRGAGSEVPLTDAERQKGKSEEAVEIPKEEPKLAETPKTDTPKADAAPKPEIAPKAEIVKEETAKPAPSTTPRPDAAAIAANAVKPEVVAAQATKPTVEAPKPHDAAKSAPAKPASVKATPAKVAAKGGSTRVQLGAFRSESEAADRVKHLGNRVPGILSGKSTTVERADLGEKGIYYRLFALNFSHDEATAACARIKAARLDCMVK